MDLLNFLKNRELGYNVHNREKHDLSIQRMGRLPKGNNFQQYSAVGDTYACKFSKNKSNLHVLGYSTENGQMIVENSYDTHTHSQKFEVHKDTILNFDWAEPEMTFITACIDKKSKLCHIIPEGKIAIKKEFTFNSRVNSVMFCPESSDIFCAGCDDGKIHIQDARINNQNAIIDFNCSIQSHHFIPVFGNKNFYSPHKILSVKFKNDNTVISCSAMDPEIKVWDLRSIRLANTTEVMKYLPPPTQRPQCNGFTDIVLNPQATRMYGSGVDDIIYCYQLDSTDNSPLCKYLGHVQGTLLSKISISNDGRYLVSGCENRGGVIWLTDFPHIEEPLFEMSTFPGTKSQLFNSDWCADPACVKLIGNTFDSPEIWSMLTDEQIQSPDYSGEQMCRTLSWYQSILNTEELNPSSAI